VLEMLNLVEPCEIGKMDPLCPELAHLLVQAKQIAYHDRDRLLADPEFQSVPVERLISNALCGRAPAPDEGGPRASLEISFLPSAPSQATRCSSARWITEAMPPP